jgi:hypothetical protein
MSASRPRYDSTSISVLLSPPPAGAAGGGGGTVGSLIVGLSFVGAHVARTGEFEGSKNCGGVYTPSDGDPRARAAPTAAESAVQVAGVPVSRSSASAAANAARASVATASTSVASAP